VIESDNLVF
jgi:hypothetical protein